MRIYQDFALTSRIVVRKVFNVDYVFNFTNHGYFAAKQHFVLIASFQPRDEAAIFNRFCMKKEWNFLRPLMSSR